jgi:DNA-binding Lrp family transcriptional regulator
MQKIETLRNKDLRKYSILPIRAVQDPEINRTAALAVLAVMCSYTDELGRTFVSQARIAKDLGISRQAANKQIKRLLDLGYLVYAKKQYKGQTTNTVKVIYDMDVKDEEEARSNLSAKEQMELAEREAGLVNNRVNKPRKEKVSTFDLQPDGLHQGATSEVAPPATSKVAQNETLTSNINEYKDKARMMCVMFLRVADAYGTPRQYQERDEQMMATWVSQGLEPDTWKEILTSHVEYCRSNSRDMARGIGYFQEPVKRALGKSRSPEVNKLLQGLKRSLRA